VGLVGVLNADNMLNFPDFRSSERSFQLMLQVAGRAGRKNKRGKVVIQTSNTSHPVIRHLRKNDYHAMYMEQMEERSDFHYPPYYRLLRIILKHRQKELLEKAAGDLADRLKNLSGGQVLGPQFPPVSRVQKWHLMMLMIKIPRGKDNKGIKQEISREIETIRSGRKYGKIVIIPDVDPM